MICNKIYNKSYVRLFNLKYTSHFGNSVGVRWYIADYNRLGNKSAVLKSGSSLRNVEKSLNECNARLFASSTRNPVTPRQKLTNAVKDYGATVIVFHVSISLVSLGLFYLIVYSGLDVNAFLNYCGLQSNERLTSVASGAGTFVVAYAVHKIFAPVRISITLAATPFIVRYLRNIGILKIKKQ